MEAALGFAAEIGAAAQQPERSDARVLELITRLIDVDVADYSSHAPNGRVLYSVDHPAEASAIPWAPTEHEWQVIDAQHPFCRHADRGGDPYFHAHRLSDVANMSSFVKTEFYALNLCAVSERPHALQMRIPGAAGTRWQLNLSRGGRHDFTVRDRLLLDALRAPLLALEAHRQLADARAQLRAAQQASLVDDMLSAREKEILDLVATGASNTEIAKHLWIAPGTVRKHLEHIYRKLDVGSRTAALALTGRASVPQSSNTYSHVSPDLQRKAAATMEAALG